MRGKGLRKVITTALISSLLFSTVVYGANGLTAKFTNIKLFLNGEPINQQVVSVSDSSYLPIRAISEALNLKVDWKGEEQTIYLTSKEGTVATNAHIIQDSGAIDKLQKENQELKNENSILHKEVNTYINQEIEGQWTGVYSAQQGETNLTINIFKNNSGDYKAEFIFSATKYNTAVPSGKYIMDVDYNKETQAIKLTGEKWVDQPSNYVMVDLVGSVSGDYINGAVISGSEYAGNFSVKKR